MNGIKKFISVCLASLMIMGGAVMTFAKNFDDVKEDNSAKVEISILTDIGVIKGTGENEFSPDENVTREQMAAFLFRLMMGRDDAGRVNTTKFDDLYEPHYHGAISWANAAGYIKGISPRRFNPTGGITKQDAMTMLVRALGQDNGNMDAGYPWSFINAAVKLGLDRGLEDVAYTDTLTRAETAVLLYNALTSEYIVGRTTVNGGIYFESTSVIEEVYGYEMAQGTIVATNDYTLDGATVVKNGYVSVRCIDGEGAFFMTVPASEMGLDGEENDHIGKSFSIIYNKENSKYKVLSAVQTTEVKEFDSIESDTVRDKVVVGEEKYTLVDEFSDELTTNNNELMLFAFDGDGTLELIESTDELSQLLGFYRVTLMLDRGRAKIGLIRVFEMGTFNIDKNGNINIAGGKNTEDLTITGVEEIKNGDRVLFYYNAETAELEIAAKLELATGVVTRLTSTTVKIGENTFKLGNEIAGITAESIKNKLVLGAEVTVVVHNGAALEVIEGVTVTDSSRYLIALSDAHKVYENGSFRYVMEAYIDGEEKHIYVKDDAGREGQVYRFTENGGVYNLIAPTVEDGIILAGKNEFVQNSGSTQEIAYIIDSANGTKIELGGRNYYTVDKGESSASASVAGLSDIRFVCDNDTVIIVNNGGKLIRTTGAFTSTINVNDGAQVVAVLDNEVGSVETLKFLYISDGSLGNYDIDADFVRILAHHGLVFENNKAYNEYVVYNFASGKIETMLSVHDSLTVGQDYRSGSDGTITTEAAEVVQSGFVTGYTSGTVSIDGATFTLATDIKIINLTDEFKIEDVQLSDLYMKNVEFVAENNVISLIIAGGEAQFTASVTAEEGKITLTPDFDLANFADDAVAVTKLTINGEAVSLEGATSAIAEGNVIEIVIADETVFESGEYEIEFSIGTKTFKTAFEAFADLYKERDESDRFISFLLSVELQTKQSLCVS